MTSLIRVDGLRSGYGASVVIDDVSFDLQSGQSLALLGRNGVGKSTLLMTLMGFADRHRGSIAFEGRDVTSMPAYQRVRRGLGWVPQERLVFPSLTVEEHLVAVARPGRWDLPGVYALFPRLKERKRNSGLQLSGGEQQMLAIARALMTNPRALLLDEPMEGLAPVIVQHLCAAMEKLIRDGTTSVVVVEQHASLALKMTDQVIVLDRGKIVHRGESAALLADRDRLTRLLSVH